MCAAYAVELPAFPGAEGNGSTSPGGRGGEVMLVTTLDDSGPGSLREACEAEGPRIVVINVDGVIELESPIRIVHPFVTIAGQRAPGGGVCLKQYGIDVAANDVVIRYLRVRPGNASAEEAPGIRITNSDVIVDHCSIGWTSGPAVSVSGDSDGVTLQWCMFTESLFDAAAASKPGTGVALASDSATFSLHHNYFAHNNTGSPYLSGAASPPGPILDFRNNVVYDWGARSGNSASNVARYNIVGNIYKAGPSTPYEVRAKAFRFGSVESRIYAGSNTLEGSDMATGTNFFLWTMPDEYILRVHFKVFEPKDPFVALPVTTLPYETMLRRVLSESGATQPGRDAVDERVIAQHRLGGGRLIASPLEVGGWADYAVGDRPLDSDGDGMPDDWERSFGLSPTNAGDQREDADGDGYTNIEEYLNSTAPAAPIGR